MNDQEIRENFEHIRAAARALWDIEANDAYIIPAHVHTLIVPYVVRDPDELADWDKHWGLEDFPTFRQARIDLHNYVDADLAIDLWIGHAEIHEKHIIAVLV